MRPLDRQSWAQKWAFFLDSPGIRDPFKAEREQAVLRIIIGAVCTGYFAVAHFIGKSGETYDAALWIGSFFVVLSIALYLWIRTSGGPQRRARRFAGILLDATTASIGLALYGEAALPLYPVYLWVIFGNGFRFGVLYLAASTLASIAGLTSAVAINSYFLDHPMITAGLFFGLLLLPAYIAMLLGKLNRTIRIADAANKAKSIFLANMSHELRTPLYSVIGGVECLADTKLTREQRSLLEGMNTSGQALLTLISDILDLAKVDANKLILNTEDFDLHLLVNGTVQILGAEADRKQILLRTRIDPAVPYRLQGDAHHIRQVLLNLLGNAVKFTNEGHIDVRVLAREISEKGVTLRIEIEDTGVGIPYAAQPRIFEMFTQADESSSRRFGGSGLGTTIAKRIIEAMGGAIGFTSDPGKGSTFWFEVPVAVSIGDFDYTATLADRRVLLVSTLGEDYDFLMRTISEWGANVTVTASASRAIHMIREAAARAKPFNAAVLCLDLMDFDPLQFVEEFVTTTARRSTTLVLVDLNQQSDVRRQDLIRRGYDQVLSAPVNKYLLYNALRAAPGTTLPESVIDLSRYHAAREGAPPRLLVLDDDELSRNVTDEILSRGGYAVDTVADPAVALDLLGKHQYDLVITDFQMPEMDGAQLINLYRFSLPERPAPFLVLTADATVDTRKAVNEAGAAGFLVKPVPSNVILKTVHDILERQRGVA